MCKYSAIRAGVDKQIKFSVCNIKHFRPLTEKSGFIITNPPYGERIGGEDKELESLYASIEAGEELPAWAAPAVRKVNAMMQQRGLGASSMAAAAITQSIYEAALPIAANDAMPMGLLPSAN